MFITNLSQILRLKTSHILNSANSQLSLKWFLLKKLKTSTNRIVIRQISHKTNTKNQDSFLPFMDMVTYRRTEAKRSIIVQVQSAQSFRELYSYCSKFGTINQMLHYTVGSEQLHFIIVEFDNESCVNSVVMNSSHLENTQNVPVHSTFLWFKFSGRKASLKQAKTANLNVENGNQSLNNIEIKESLQQCNSVSEQISSLHNITTLNDVATRLRFLTAHQIELSLSGMFPNAVAYPFGSSVNGFGKMGCDLDVVFRFTPEKLLSEENRLIFHCKAVNGYERSIAQRHMEVIGDMLQLFLPGCTQIRKILQARVPIIKYYQQLTDVECDLSMSNMSGVHMSDLLYLYGSMDPRVRPLVFAIKKWAESIGLTNNSPGRWITNFSLTLLVLFFLQQPSSSGSILPSFNTLVRKAGSTDKYITEDGVNCTFLRDIKVLNYNTTNTDNLETLFKQFCEFYSTFDFSSRAVCLNEASSITKPEHSALYIVNPLERGLNVSKNISPEELEKFKHELRNALWLLELQEQKEENSWGILDILENKKKSYANSFLIPKQARLMEVSAIFNDQNSSENMESKSEKIEKDRNRRKLTENGRIRNRFKSKR